MWGVRLAAGETVAGSLYATLSPDERQRAARFHFDVHRQRFALSRGLLRTLLGYYLEADPATLPIVYGPQGKPGLEGGSLRFNVSHSEDLALYALALDSSGTLELGVDVESIRPVPYAESIARRFFCPAEWQEIQSLPPEQRAGAFFRCWTRKEAYVKALGGGLSVPLDRFQVTLLPGQPAKLVSLDGDPVRAAEWSLYHLDPARNYAGALAVHSLDFHLCTRYCRHLEDSLEQLSR